MKIGEAQQIYRDQVQAYQKQKRILSKQLQTARSRMEALPEGISEKDREECASEVATLELTLDKLDEKQSEYQDYLNQLAEQYCAYWNAAVGEQQADAAAEYAVDMAKLIEGARRIMRGGIVPAADEKKLMEYNFEMYQTAKNIGALVQSQKKEKYKTLWGDEEEKEYADPKEAAENGTAPEGPEVIDASAMVESAAEGAV